MTFANTYMITNRYYPDTHWSFDIYPLDPGLLYFFVAPGEYNSNHKAYQQVGNATDTMPPTFASQLAADLQIAIRKGCPQITLYVHGLANYFSDTCKELGVYGSNLQTQGYNGLVIAFDWPSYGEYESYKSYGTLPYSFPPTKTYGSIRDNINGSVQSFINLLSMLSDICTNNNAKLNLMCHSEGNYMLMLGMRNPNLVNTLSLNQALLLAADINAGALQVNSYSPPMSGQLNTIGPLVSGATVYWSSNDDALPWAQGWPNYHNPSFPNRLGLYGPASYVVDRTKGDALMSKAYGLDCSLVVNQDVMNKTGVPPNTTVHSSYFYIPQVLQDISQTLNGVPPANVVNRVNANQPDNRAFTMEVAPDLLTGPIAPTGKSLESKTPEGPSSKT